MECYFAIKAQKENLLILDHFDTKHIITVLRHRINDKIIVVYEKQKYLTKIIKLEPVIICQIIKTLDSISELNNKVTLVMALLKGDKFDLIIQKAVELGVFQIVPIILERCVSVISNQDKAKQKNERWQNIAKAAAKQANRNIIPKIQPIITIENLNLYKSDINYLAYENEKNNVNWTKIINKNQSVTIVVGPEGGIANQELKIFQQLAFTNISLGPTILRAETAPLYFLSVVNYYQATRSQDD